MAYDERSDAEQLSSIREMVESIWIAIVLAFILRAFVIEAFVIPTGSMAPRLMGKHWQLDCPACKHHYARGSSDSEPFGTAPCPNCRDDSPKQAQMYGGDRVLVLKYLYNLREPAPWDVVVFKNPQDNEQNYIKRLIGLPGQQIEIVHGDVFYRDGKDFNADRVIDEKDFEDPAADRECPWRILRKSPRTQEVMWDIVFDNNYQPDPHAYRGQWEGQWQSPWRDPTPEEAWDKPKQGGRVFCFKGGGQRGQATFEPDSPLRFFPLYAYNRPDEMSGFDERNDVNSDLNLSFMFVPKAADSRVGLYLSSLRHHFRAWVGADGRCRLEHRLADQGGQVNWPETVSGDDVWGDRHDLPPLELDRGHDVALTHVDQKVTLWLDGEAVVTSTDENYSMSRRELIEETRVVPIPTVAILAEGGASELWRIKLMRDVYYTSTGAKASPPHGVTGSPMLLRKFLNRPDMDEFFVLGDNSPASLDSRWWAHHAPSLRDEKNYVNGTVPRYNMIGKAFFVYWPGGYRIKLLEKVPILGGMGIVPNVGRMRLIR